MTKKPFFASAILLASAVVLMAAMPARHFHLALKRAEPAVNDTVTASPAAVKLWFTQSIQAASTAIRLTAAGDRVIPTGAVSVDSAKLSPAIATIAERLEPGTYGVAWKTMAADGHPINGKFTFTVRATGTTEGRN